jgi:DoxX
LGTALFVCRLVLASLFLVAGVAKLIDINGTRQAVLAFGVPERLGAPVGVALPAAELAVGTVSTVHHAGRAAQQVEPSTAFAGQLKCAKKLPSHYGAVESGGG